MELSGPIWMRYAPEAAASSCRSRSKLGGWASKKLRTAAASSQPDLAKLLWAKVRSPMRSAIMAARMNAKIEARLGADHLDAETLAVRTELYEQWASGVLDQVENKDEAIALLTLVPRKRNAADDSAMLVWTDSVMDQACNEESPCKNFVARTNCQVRLLLSK